MYTFEQQEETEWISGLPKENGIFWIDIGLNSGINKENPAFVKVKNSYMEVIGRDGYLPLNVLIPANIKTNVQHAKLLEAKEWVELKECDMAQPFYGWVKTPESYVGVALIKRSSNLELIATIIWLTHPVVWLHTNTLITAAQNLKFSKLPYPTDKNIPF